MNSRVYANIQKLNSAEDENIYAKHRLCPGKRYFEPELISGDQKPVRCLFEFKTQKSIARPCTSYHERPNRASSIITTSQEGFNTCPVFAQGEKSTAQTVGRVVNFLLDRGVRLRFFWAAILEKNKKTLAAQDPLRVFVPDTLLVLNLGNGKNTSDRSAKA